MRKYWQRDATELDVHNLEEKKTVVHIQSCASLISVSFKGRHTLRENDYIVI